MERHIFIVGSAQSGTTILYRFLAMHPDLAWMSQFSQRNAGVLNKTPIAGLDVWDRLGRKVCGHTWSKSDRLSKMQRVLEKIFPVPVEAWSVWEELFPGLGNCDLSRETFDPPHTQRVRDFVNRMLFQQKCQRLLVKRPRLAFVVPYLAQVFPQAQFIHCVRDGRAVISSMVPETLARGSAQACAITEYESKYWQETLQVMANAEEALGPKRVKIVRYEDFCQNVEQSLRDVFQWCGMAFEERVFANIPKTIHPTNQSRIERLTPQERAVMDPIIENWLNRYAYVPR